SGFLGLVPSAHVLRTPNPPDDDGLEGVAAVWETRPDPDLPLDVHVRRIKNGPSLTLDWPDAGTVAAALPQGAPVTVSPGELGESVLIGWGSGNQLKAQGVSFHGTLDYGPGGAVLATLDHAVDACALTPDGVFGVLGAGTNGVSDVSAAWVRAASLPVTLWTNMVDGKARVACPKGDGEALDISLAFSIDHQPVRTIDPEEMEYRL